jgi:hypothetical protein
LAFIGLAFQTGGWRKYVRIFNLFSGLVIMGLIVYFCVISVQLGIDWDARIPFKMTDGLMIEYSFMGFMAVPLIFANFLFFTCWVFRKPFLDLADES